MKADIVPLATGGSAFNRSSRDTPPVLYDSAPDFNPCYTPRAESTIAVVPPSIAKSGLGGTPS